MLVEIRKSDKDLGNRSYDLCSAYVLFTDIYSCWPPVFVMWYDNLSELHPTNKDAKGAYSLTTHKHPFGVILLDSCLTFNEAIYTLAHEYAHHLSQQNHGFMMFELWYEYLIDEIYRRWQDADGEEDQSDNRRRHVVVREVCVRTEN